MEYISVRLTHPDNVEDLSWDNLYIDKITQVLQPLGIIAKATYGHEVSVKTKKHHFHWHIQLERHQDVKRKKGISNYIKRHLKEKHELDLPPGQCYSIKTKEIPEAEINRWHGYLFKDITNYEDIIMIHQIGFSGQELRDMWSAAARERELSIKTFEKHENKMNNDKQSRKLVWDWLDKELPQLHISNNFNEQKDDVMHIVGSKIVEYNIQYNDYKIPMDLKRRVISYLAYKGMHPGHIARLLL